MRCTNRRVFTQGSPFLPFGVRTQYFDIFTLKTPKTPRQQTVRSGPCQGGGLRGGIHTQSPTQAATLRSRTSGRGQSVGRQLAVTSRRESDVATGCYEISTDWSCSDVSDRRLMGVECRGTLTTNTTIILVNVNIIILITIIISTKHFRQTGTGRSIHNHTIHTKPGDNAGHR